LFILLGREHGMVPGFEATAALKYNPYPDPRYRITFDDLFWHLDKESMEETFDRLLERHTYGILKAFFQAYFENNREALAAICEHVNFPGLLARSAAILLKQDEAVHDQLMCHHRATWGTAFGPVEFEVYQNRKVRFLKDSDRMLGDAYADFRKCFFEERRRQHQQRWNRS
jgi:hypothetical protein